MTFSCRQVSFSAFLAALVLGWRWFVPAEDLVEAPLPGADRNTSPEIRTLVADLKACLATFPRKKE